MSAGAGFEAMRESILRETLAIHASRDVRKHLIELKEIVEFLSTEQPLLEQGCQDETRALREKAGAGLVVAAEALGALNTIYMKHIAEWA